MFRTLTSAKIAATNKAKKNGQSYVVLGNRDEGYYVMSYAWWVGSTEGDYIHIVDSDGSIDCEDK